MNAAAEHAALIVMTVSAARMYCLLRHAQHSRYINKIIQKLHLAYFPKKIGLGPADSLHSWTNYIEIAAFVLLLTFDDFSQNFTARLNARIASAVLATPTPSVCLSVRHTPVLCQNDGT